MNTKDQPFDFSVDLFDTRDLFERIDWLTAELDDDESQLTIDERAELREELAGDLYGTEIVDAEWPFNCIDWDRAASELQQDYTQIDGPDGSIWWVR